VVVAEMASWALALSAQVAEVAAALAVEAVQPPEVQLQIQHKEMLVGLAELLPLVAVVEQDLQEAALLDQFLGLAGLV
jgi:hypothetical protein